MPWWAWIIAVLFLLVAVVLLGIITMVLRLRRMVQREFEAYLARAWPELSVTARRHLALEIRLPDGTTGQLELRNLYGAIVATRAATPAQRELIYEGVVKTFRGGTMVGSRPLDERAHEEQILPRVVTPQFLSSNSELADVPRVPLGDTGLFIVLVLDGDESVMYLDKEHLDSLGMTLADALPHAVENLRRILPLEEAVRQAIKGDTVYVVETDDTYDAARVLLLPDFLRPGETLAAAVPNRDRLALMPLRDGRELDRLKMSPGDGEHQLLGDRLLKVTSEGIELLEPIDGEGSSSAGQ